MIHFLKRFNAQLTLFSMVAAIVGGIFFPSAFSSIHFLGDLFINLLKVFALPLICSALIASLGDMGNNLSSLKTVARNTIAYMLASEVMAVSIALLLFNIFKPGVGLSADLIRNGEDFVPAREGVLSISSFFTVGSAAELF